MDFKNTEISEKARGLTGQSLSGFFWTFSSFGLRAVLELAVLCVLARLLTQKDFGVVAAGMVLIKVLMIFSQAGLGPALVQKSDFENRHIRAGFSLSCLLGACLTTAVCLLSPAIAGFFRMPPLEGVLRVMSLLFAIQGLSLTAEALLQREMRFRALSLAEAASYAFGFGIVGITLALLRFGMWALVFAYLAQVSLKSILLLAVRPHSKGIRFEKKAAAELLKFGGGFSIARIFNSVAGQGDNLVIGRCLGADALGLYSKAYQLMAMPPALFGMALDKVLFPAMARKQTEKERLRQVYKRGLSMISLVILPISAAMYLLAPEITSVLLGPGWSGAIVPFRILAVGMLFRASFKLSDSLARATGAVYRRAWRQFLYAASVLLGAWAGQFWGLGGAAVGVVGAITINFFIMADLSLRIVAMSWREFLAAHVKAALLALVVLLEISAVAQTLRHLSATDALVLGISVGVTLASVLAMVRYFARFFAGQDVVELMAVLKYKIIHMRGT